QNLRVVGVRRAEFIVATFLGSEALILANDWEEQLAKCFTRQVVRVVGSRTMQPVEERAQTGRNQLAAGAVQGSEESLALGLEEHGLTHGVVLPCRGPDGAT